MANNVTREKNLEALANAIKNYADSKVATITGSGASYTLPTASETLKGGVMIGTGLSMAGDTLNVTLSGGQSYFDFKGATSVIGGASGFVPAPKAGDNEKFLRGDGIWTVPVGGGSYSIATSSQAGLMSAEDKQHLDAVFQSSADLTDAVVTVVGGKFVPSVDSFSDFITYKDSNVTFLDNKLKIVLEGYHAKDYAHTRDRMPFQFDATDIFVKKNASKMYLCSNTSSVSLVSVNASVDNNYDIYKLSESAGFLLRTATITKDYKYQYSAPFYLAGFVVSESGEVSLHGTTHTIAAVSTTVASANAHNAVCIITPSAQDPSNLLFVTERHANNNVTYTYSDCYVNAYSGAVTTIKAETTIGTDYTNGSGTAEKTNIDELGNSFSQPRLTFTNGKVVISCGDTQDLPFVRYIKTIRDSSGEVTGGGAYVLFCRGNNRAAPQTLQLTTIDGGVTSTLQPWFEDDDNLIAGVWNAKSDNQIYAVTFKKGTYDFSVDWFDKYSTVWTFDFLTPRIIKTAKKLSEIIDDLQL